MKKLLFLIFIAFAIFSVVSIIGCGDDDTDYARIRVIHGSYDAPPVDVYVGGSKKISGLSYGESSGYGRVKKGNRGVEVTPAGAAAPVVIDAVLALGKDKRITVYAVNKLDDIEPIVSFVDERRTTAGKAKVRFIHASPDAPDVDIKLNAGDGPVVFDDTTFKNIEDYIEVDPGSYTFVVTPFNSDDEVIKFNPVTLQADTVYTVVALGTFDDGDDYPFFVRVFVDSGDGDLFVDFTAGDVSNLMAVHASPDAPPVDIYADGIFQGTLDFPDNTGYIVLHAGTRSIKVNVEGTTTTAIGPVDLTLDADEYKTVFAYDEVADIKALVLDDDLTDPAAGKAHVRFVHLSPDAPAVDIAVAGDAVGDAIFKNVAFGETSGGLATPGAFTPLDADTYDLDVRLEGTLDVVLSLDDVTLGDQKIYTVFAKDFVADLGAEIIVNK
jgi:hypothetical protein